jgi:intein/homing endonuclease
MIARWQLGGDLREHKEKFKAKRMQTDSYRKSVLATIARNKKNSPGVVNKGRHDQKGIWNARAKRENIFQKIYSAYEPGMTLEQLAEKLEAPTHLHLLNRLGWAGYVDWNNFVSRYSNHKVVSVRKTNVIEPVYDITVNDYHNFALSTKDGKGLVFVHNSEMESCVAGDTLIAIPGGYSTIKELSEKYGPDETFVVYSYDHSKRTIVPALGKQARKTTTAPALKVTFDSGKFLIATPDHRVMKRDGTYCEVQELEIGTSMMPFYRRDLFSDNEKQETSDGYRFIYTMDKENSKLSNGWIPEHKLIAEFIAGRKLTADECVHHKNFIKHDNRPENLQIMTNDEHRAHHAGLINRKKRDVENNTEWIESFKKKHSDFMKSNNPAQRHDITFELILNLCDMYGYNLYELSRRLDCSIPVIYRRINEKGFSNFEQFATAYCPEWRNNGHDNTGKKKSRYDKSLTVQRVYDAFKPGMQLKDMLTALDTTAMKLGKRLHEAGFKSWKDFSATYQNHRVVSIEDYGTIDLFDLTVDGYKNYSTDSIVIHNTPEIASALDIYAEETVSSDDKHRVLHIHSDNRKIQEILNELFYDTLNVDFNLVMWTRNLTKYGDFFLFNDISPEFGIINVYPISITEMEREEGFDPLDPSAVRFRWITNGNQTLQNWQISHFRLLGNDAFLPYGSSVLESARRIWRQLIMMEDAMLVYRVIRAPERRVFYIDVGATPPENIADYMEQAQTNLKRNQVVDKNNGKVDLRYNPLSVDEDYFLPVRGGESGTKIDTLAGGQNTAAIEDVQYIQKKLFAALKIPKAYLGYDEEVGAKATLAQEDIRFSRSIQRIQKTIISELNKMAMIHLYCHGFEGEDLVNFKLNLTNPSSTAQQQKLQLISTRFEIAGKAPEGMVDREWIRKNIIGLTNDEIASIKEGKIADKKEDAEVEAAVKTETEASAEPAGGEAEGEGDLFSGDKKDDNNLLTALPAQNREEKTLTDAEDDDSIALSIDDEDAPVKAQQKLLNVFGGPIKPSRSVTDGPGSTHMPDFAKMTSVGDFARKQDTSNKPFDDDFLLNFKEGTGFNTSVPSPAKLSREMEKMLGNLGKKINRSRKSLLSEDLSEAFNEDPQ